MTLLAAIGLVGVEIYEVWQQRMPVLDSAGEAPADVAEKQRAASEERAAPSVSTRTIVARNLFDPDRGAKVDEPAAPVKKEEEPAPNIEGLLLLGTVIAGSDRYAIMQVPPDVASIPANRRRAKTARTARSVAQAGAGVRRVRVGDSLRGYEVKGIEEQKVVLARGEAETELTIDYTREVPVPQKPKAKVKKPTRKIRQRAARNRRTRNRRDASRTGK